MADDKKKNQQKSGAERNEDLHEQVRFRLEKLEAMEAEGQDPFQITKAVQEQHSVDVLGDNFAAWDGQTVALCGRLMSKRGMGKVSFCDLQDRRGKIQIFTKVDELGETLYKAWQKLDIGDLVEVQGQVFRTERGEISVRNQGYRLLSKALRPLPEKFHGLQNTDTRYRKRYVDLIMNPEVRDTFEKRSRIIAAMRRVLEEKDFIEVETPILNMIAGGATARPFITHHNALDLDLYLRISPELYLKRLIVGGFERVYEIGRNFRNEGMDVRHNPEFSMVELYQAYTDYHGMMDIAEEIMSRACLAVNPGLEISYNGIELNLTPPFRRLSMIEAVKMYAGVDFDVVRTQEEALKLAKEHHLEDLKDNMAWGDILNLFFEHYCEEKLVQPTFIYDYPVEISPLTKKKPSDTRLVERFELFICGTEFGNAYSELNDPRDQRERFQEQLRRRQEGDDEANLPDEEYVEALEYGLPPTGGLGMGIDRMVMLLTDNVSIRDVLLFPTMKPLDTPKDKNGVQKSEEAATTETASEEAPTVNANDPSMPIFDAKKPDFASLVIEPLFEDLVDFETFSKSDFRAVKVKDCVAVPKSKKLLQFTLDDGSGTDRTILSGIHAYYEPEQLIGKTCIAITNLPPRKMMGIDSCGMLISAVHKEGEEEKLHLLMVDPSIPAGAKLY